MDATLVATLQREERLILAELRGSTAFRRLEEIRELLRLYDEQPPVGSSLDALIDQAPRHRPPWPGTGPIALRGERASA
jgi:hypothetical protein